MKKTVKMLNSGSSKLDQILTVGKVAGDHMGLGYKGESSSTKTIFVPAAKVEKPEMNQKKTRTQSGTRSSAPGKKWVPVCHYCERVGHIRPRCFQYLADLRKIDKKKPQRQSLTKQVWMKKSDLQCNMASTSSKATGKIIVENNIFRGKHEVGVQGELAISSDVLYDAPENIPKNVFASSVDTPGCGRLDISTTRIYAGGAEESSKEVKKGRIPLFLVFLCLFLAKRRSTC